MCILSVLSVLALSSSAGAVTITHSTNGQLLYDNFESVNPGDQPDNTIWTVSEGDANGVLRVTDDVPPDGPGPAEGSQYTRMYRKLLAPNMTGNFPIQTGGSLHVEYMLYIPELSYLVYPTMGLGEEELYTIANYPPNGLSVYGASGWVATTISNVTTNKWQKWEVDWDIDAGSYEITVDGSSTGTLTTFSGWGSDIDDIYFGTGDKPSTYYVDAVSEFLRPGNANGDFIVNDADAAILADNWQKQTGAIWAEGDFNDDGRVDDYDATILAANWQQGTTTVPEPTTLMLLTGVLLCFLPARRRPVHYSSIGLRGKPTGPQCLD